VEDFQQEVSLFGGLDLGQSKDFTALSILKRTRLVPPPGPRVEQVEGPYGRQTVVYDGRPRPAQPRHRARYVLDFLERYDLGTPYPVINDRIVALYGKQPLAGSRLVVDYTGAGMPVVDWLRRSKPRCVICPVLITAGSKVTYDKATGSWHVAKKELVSALQVVLQGRRLDVAGGLRHAPVLLKELEAFKVKMNAATGNEQFEAWRERDHDDMVLSVALAVWMGERGGEFFIR
jgi:hypothetical protein